MLSFRDQADNGVFDLIGYFTSAEAGTQDDQSREYIFMHKYDYDDTNPHSTIAADGGLENGMLYFFWPYLQGDRHGARTTSPRKQLLLNLLMTSWGSRASSRTIVFPTLSVGMVVFHT